MNIFQFQAIYLVALAAIDKNSVFTAAVNILETDVFDLSGSHSFFPVTYRNIDGLRPPPPLLGKPPCLNIQIGDQYIPYASFVPELERHSPVAAADITVFYNHILKIIFALCADFYSGTGRY